MGKSTTSMAIFNSYVTNYQRVTHIHPCIQREKSCPDSVYLSFGAFDVEIPEFNIGYIMLNPINPSFDWLIPILSPVWCLS